MNELSIGQQVELEYGDKATVTGIIGSGGQGTVYTVDYNGKKWALQWYDISKMKEPDQVRG
ncbi:MAG: protein kinase, partial [Ruminiclostridium sp.]|nr:protein kinase [Ruminiclostridium sp.]